MFKKVTVILNNGTKFETKGAFPGNSETMRLDIDPTNHPAWRKDGGVLC